MNARKFLEGLWADELEDLAEAQVVGKGRELLTRHFAANEDEVAEGVKKVGDASIREILYHLWRTLLPGWAADKLRDRQEAKIQAACAPLIHEDTDEVTRIRIVAGQVVELIF